MTTRTYAPEKSEAAQKYMQLHEAEIRRELDIQREKYPDIYAGAPLFCQEAREGRVTAYTLVLEPSRLKLLRLPDTQPCGCYYGAGSNHDEPLASSRADTMREACCNGRKIILPDTMREACCNGRKIILPCTPIEHYLFACAELEESPRDEFRPLPWENPGIQLLVALIEKHLAQ